MRLKRLREKTIAIICALIVTSIFLSAGTPETPAQTNPTTIKQQRKQERAQKRAEHQGASNLTNATETASTNQTRPATTADPARTAKHSLDGISKTGVREFFSKDEREMVIPGFGRPVAYLIILRQLDLTEEQKQSIKAVRRRVGNQLVVLRQQYNLLDTQLEDAIYGENYDPKRVDELSAQTGEKQAEIIKMQASIESQMRQALTPDQFFVFRFLVGEMLLPQRRPLARPQQMQRRMGQTVQ
jgi:Spy/CpxP family protein refolding chaperone